MVLWGVVWGAILGLLWPGWDEAGTVVGAVLGALAGWTLRMAVHGEVKAAAPNPFALDPANSQHGSDRLYESLREVLKR